MVNPSMTFFNFQDFYIHAKRIKEMYACLSVEEKRIYKMYVYSNRLLSDKKVDKVWEYLNEPFGSVYYVSYEMLGEYL